MDDIISFMPQGDMPLIWNKLYYNVMIVASGVAGLNSVIELSADAG